MTVKPNEPIFIELDKRRELRYDWSTISSLERVSNLQFSDIMIQIQARSFGVVRTTQMMWAAFIHEDPNLTLQQVEKMLDTKDWEEYTDVISKAFERAFPQADEGEGKNEPGSNGLSKNTSEQATK